MGYETWGLDDLVSEFAMVKVELEAYEDLGLEVPKGLKEKRDSLRDKIEVKIIETKKLRLRRLEQEAEALKTKEERRKEVEEELAALREELGS